MAIQTVDFNLIDSVIHNGTPITEFTLDGVAIWTAPPPPQTFQDATRNYENTNASGPFSIYGGEIAVSGDGLVLARLYSSGRIDIASRTSITSTTWTIRDTLTTEDEPYDLNFSDDGEILCYGLSGEISIFATRNPNTGLYTTVDAVPDSSSPKISSDGTRRFFYRYPTGITMEYNISTPSSPDFRQVLVIKSTNNIYGISKRINNRMTVVCHASSTRVYDVSLRNSIETTFTSAVYYRPKAVVIEQNSVADSRTYSSKNSYKALNANRYISVSDDGRYFTAAGFYQKPYWVADPNYSSNSVVSIFTDNTNLRPIKFSHNQTTSSYLRPKISGDGKSVVLQRQGDDTEVIYVGSDGTDFSRTATISDNNIGDLGVTMFGNNEDQTIFRTDGMYAMTPTYELSAPISAFITEGGSVAITLATTSLGSGSLVDYTITGVQAADILEPLTGSFTVTDNSSTIVINAVEDLTTEGNQDFTLTIDDDPSKSVTITIQDTSTTP